MIAVGSLAVLAVAVPAATVRSSAAADSSTPAITGSWYAPLCFISPYVPEYGQTENTLITFDVNGGVVEVNPVNPSQANQGSWVEVVGNTYKFRLVEFTYDATTHGVSEVHVPTVTFQVDDRNTFHSVASEVTIAKYDAGSGAMQSGYPKTLSNVVIQRGHRLTIGYVPPATFPAEPPVGSCTSAP